MNLIESINLLGFMFISTVPCILLLSARMDYYDKQSNTYRCYLHQRNSFFPEMRR